MGTESNFTSHLSIMEHILPCHLNIHLNYTHETCPRTGDDRVWVAWLSIRISVTCRWCSNYFTENCLMYRLPRKLISNACSYLNICLYFCTHLLYLCYYKTKCCLHFISLFINFNMYSLFTETAQPLVRADRPKSPSKLTVFGPFVYRDQVVLLH